MRYSVWRAGELSKWVNFSRGEKRVFHFEKVVLYFLRNSKPEIAGDKEWTPSPASILFPLVGKGVRGRANIWTVGLRLIFESHGLVSSFSFFKDSANMMFALFTPAIYCNVGEYFASYRIMCRVVFNNQSPWRCILQRDKPRRRLEWWYLLQWILR